MTSAYVDTSCLVAIIFGEAGYEEIAKRLTSFGALYASNLLEAEFRAALAREGVPQEAGEEAMSWIRWVYPNRPLTLELNRILTLGYLRGADLWHVACALFLDPSAGSLHFLTVDDPQQRIASRLNFRGL